MVHEEVVKVESNRGAVKEGLDGVAEEVACFQCIDCSDLELLTDTFGLDLHPKSEGGLGQNEREEFLGSKHLVQRFSGLDVLGVKKDPRAVQQQ